MALNEYLVIKGGDITTELDDNAHRFAKMFAESKKINLQEKAILTKSMEINFRHPIKTMRCMDFRLCSSVRFDKNHNISVNCTLVDRKNGKVGAEAHITFSVIDRNSIEGRLVGVTRKRKG